MPGTDRFPDFANLVVATSSNAPVARKLLALLLATAPLVSAQQPAVPEAAELASRALVEMEADRWEEALELLTRCVAEHDEKAPGLHDPSFGVTWYRKGICELRLQRWDEAAASFDTCYRKYPNPSGESGNLYHKRALLRGAEAALGAGKHAEAIRLSEKFLQERDPARDTFEPAPFYLNLALCRFHLGQLAEGIESFETALQNKQRFRTPDLGVAAAFQSLVAAAVAKREEKTLLAFMNRNRAAIVIEPFEMEPFAVLYLKLAADALVADMDAVALELSRLVPPAEVMNADLKSRLARLGPRAEVKELTRTVSRAKLQASLDALEQRRDAGEPHDAIQLGLVAVIHEKRGNLRGARAAYRELDRHFPKSAKREDHRYHLVRLTAALSESAADAGGRFLADFPDSKHLPAVRRLLLSSMFQAGDHEGCAGVAMELLPKLAVGSAEHDLALHVAGASRYYLGFSEVAQPLLDQHVETYPKSPQSQAARFFQASNLARLRKWPEAAAALDRFLADAPGPYLPFALQDRASCHIAQDQPDAALVILRRLEKEFSESEVLDAALLVKARLLQSEGKTGDAIVSYQAAVDAAKRRSHPELAAEGLWQLVVLSGGKPEAIAWADRFWKEHADSRYRSRMAVAQLDAMTAAGRGDEALDRLRGSLSTDGGSAPLERYADAYAAKHGLEALDRHLRELPGFDPAQKSAVALLRFAFLAVAEKQTGEAAEARIKALYQELKSGFTPQELAPAQLVRLGDHLRTKTSAPRQALPYYEEALARAETDFHTAARFGRASVLATGSPEEKARALEDFKQIATAADDDAVKDLALLRLAETQLAAGDAGQAAESARQYLAREDARFAGEAGLLLGKSYETAGKAGEALAAYREVWTRWQEVVRLSAPAMLAWLDLATRQGQPADTLREPVLNYLARTKPAFDTWTDAEKSVWQEIGIRLEKSAGTPLPPARGEKP